MWIGLLDRLGAGLDIVIFVGKISYNESVESTVNLRRILRVLVDGDSDKIGRFSTSGKTPSMCHLFHQSREDEKDNKGEAP